MFQFAVGCEKPTLSPQQTHPEVSQNPPSLLQSLLIKHNMIYNEYIIECERERARESE